ncbi:MAG: class flavin-dependent oxidoreductase [Acidimicrobiales bacterium]|jgi:alkanesulfonate monooxygenase SsuD/methylene tetrahydromethanopterin reductase-like flavin-dependent oxidoreductase (luciferase family)|nr:class flavin-dependent oxidoreductase [Acidimicrobiales bacterium]
MKFALFYEIPVARPWDPESEYRAYKNTIEQAVLGDKVGFHSFWTVEHHFLEEYSHCSNPEILYGAIAAQTQNLRIGYGVRLLPKPYNHPIRTAESVAVLDLISDGRVEFGTGRSSTRMELEGFDVSPHETRAMWSEALDHIVAAWTEEYYQADGEYWKMGAPRRVQPKPRQQPHPPIWGATSSPDGHYEMGKHGVGLCSFTVGVPPEELVGRVELYRKGLSECTKPAGKFVNDQAATFTMVHCAPTKEEAYEVGRESFEWYPQHGAGLIASVAEWMEETGTELETYGYTGDALKHQREGAFAHMNFDYIHSSGSGVIGDPDECIAAAKRYEACGVDLLLCLVNPYNIPHDKVMQSIELMGKHVIPEFA